MTLLLLKVPYYWHSTLSSNVSFILRSLIHLHYLALLKLVKPEQGVNNKCPAASVVKRILCEQRVDIYQIHQLLNVYGILYV